MVTVLPRSSSLPPDGFCEITLPTVSSDSCSCTVVLRPALWISDSAEAYERPTASGTLTDTSGSEYELTLHQSYVRIGKNVMTVGVTGVSDQSALQTGYTQIAIDRLVSVIIDSDPSETTGPQPA